MSPEQVREQKLIRAAAAGDRGAASRLITLHQGSLYSYLVRLTGRPDVAEDVVQEAFVRVLTNLGRFDPRFRFSTWLFTIARRVYLNMREKKCPTSNSERVEETMGAGAGVGARLEAEEEQGGRRDEIGRALMALTMDQREVIVLFHQLEWPIWLIAQHLDMPEGTVKSHLHRGRLRLREALGAARNGSVGHDAQARRTAPGEVRS